MYRAAVTMPSPLPEEVVNATFAKTTLNKWPTGYLPTATAASLMRAGGIPVPDLIATRSRMMGRQNLSEIKDLTADYVLWTRSAFEDHVLFGGSATERAVTKLTNRLRLPRHSDACDAFNFSFHRSNKNKDAKPSGADPVADISNDFTYKHSSHAHGQIMAMRPVQAAYDAAAATSQKNNNSNTMGPLGNVVLSDFEAVHNVLNMSYHSLGPMTHFLNACGDPFLWNREVVAELGVYLASRIEQHAAWGVDSKDAPVLCVFSNGRLAHFLNQSGILHVPVVAYSGKFSNKTKARDRTNRTSLPGIKSHDEATWDTTFELTHGQDITDVLMRVKPQIVIVEPHTDRDWTAELRGYPSVREVVYLGQVESPAMASFSLPFLSWGVLPGPNTYMMYGDDMRPQDVQSAGQESKLPMEPPYVLQGYKKLYVDSVSKYLIGKTDSDVYPFSNRCLVHRRLSPQEQADKAAKDALDMEVAVATAHRKAEEQRRQREAEEKKWNDKLKAANARRHESKKPE